MNASTTSGSVFTQSVLSILIVCSVSALQPAAPSPMPAGLARVALGAKQRYDNIKRDIAKSAEAVPESEYAFKPAPQVRSFGELSGHVADVNNFYCAIANSENPNWLDTTEKTVTTKADLVKALKTASSKCDDVIARTNEGNALSLVPAGPGNQLRIMVILDNVAHLNEHYGNIVTYMRQKGHVPPSTLREQKTSGSRRSQNENPAEANGSRRMRRPVAAKIAFATAGAIGGSAISPKPVGFSVLGTMWTSIDGASRWRSSG